MGRSMSKAFTTGRNAAKQHNRTGGNIPKNPYDQIQQSTESVDWEEGFDSLADY